jgi:hypothetical protein
MGLWLPPRALFQLLNLRFYKVRERRFIFSPELMNTYLSQVSAGVRNFSSRF